MKQFEGFQFSKGIDIIENGFHEYANCYFSSNKEFSECFFLEDLRNSHFTMLNHRTEVVTFDHVALAIKALGKFHALSFAFKDQNPEQFAEIATNLNDLHWQFSNAEFSALQTHLKDRMVDILKKCDDKNLIERFDNAFVKGFEGTTQELMSAANAEPYAVVCHGDFWINNCMYKNDGNLPIDIKLIDWQFTRYASPITDLVHFLFCCTSKKLRDQYYFDLIKIYHSSLTDLLKRYSFTSKLLFVIIH